MWTHLVEFVTQRRTFCRKMGRSKGGPKASEILVWDAAASSLIAIITDTWRCHEKDFDSRIYRSNAGRGKAKACSAQLTALSTLVAWLGRHAEFFVASM